MYLIDTNILIFQLHNSSRLKPEVATLLEEFPDQIHVSVISAWEIIVKQMNGKLTLHHDPMEYARQQGVSILPFELSDLVTLKTFPPAHKDPFDRALIAQAAARQLTLITTDKIFTKYPINVLLA